MTSAVEITAAKYLMGKGIPIGAAVAITSVFYYESKLNPGPQGDQPTETPGVINPRGAVGIMSLNGPRQASLLSYAQKRGLPWDNLETQLDFALNEMANSYPQSWAAVRAAATYSSIIPILVNEYENPKDKPKEIAGAMAFAGPLFAAVQSAPPVIAGPPIPSGYFPPPGVSSMDPVLAAQIAQLVAPLVESLASGLIKGLMSHLVPSGVTAAPSAHPTPAPAAFDPLAIAKAIAEELAKLGVPK